MLLSYRDLGRGFQPCSVGRGARESQRGAAGRAPFPRNQTRNRIFNAEAAAGREAGDSRGWLLRAAGEASLVRARG